MNEKGFVFINDSEATRIFMQSREKLARADPTNEYLDQLRVLQGGVAYVFSSAFEERFFGKGGVGTSVGAAYAFQTYVDRVCRASSRQRTFDFSSGEELFKI